MTIWGDQNLRRVASITCLLGLTVVLLYLCYLIGKPFLGPVTIALMLSVVFHPLHARIESLIDRPNLASVVSTLLVFFIATVPVLILGIAVSGELRTVVQSLRESAPEAGLDPYLRHWREVLQQRVGNYMNLSQFDLHATLLRWAEQAS